MTGKYRPYPAYKDSGVEWLGDIPKTWGTIRVKNIGQLVNGATPKSSERKYWENGDIAWATPSDVNDALFLSKTLRNITRDGYKSCGTTIVPPNSLVITTRAPIGKVTIASTPLCTNQGCKSIVLCNKKISRFIYYLFLVSSEILNSLGTGTTFMELSFEDLKNYKIPFPNVQEQTKIANFLDHETAKIDTLIAKQEKLIELLQEKRQAVISHAVTKGLDPDVPMKDSGVEWLGEVPAHWETIEVKYVVKQVGGGTPSKENEEYWKGDIPWVSPKDMKVDYIKNTTDKISLTAVANSSAKLIPPGSILIVVRGMILVHSVPVAIACSTLTINQDMKALLPSEKLQNEYFLFLLKGIKEYILDLVDNSAHGTKCLRTDLFEKMTIPIPPIAEQTYITDIVKSKVQNIDKITEHSKRFNLLLKERRTALISAAVTGKIDVRNWEPNKTQYA